MRVKTSVTLPRDLLARIDQQGNNRSAFLERAAVLYLCQLEKGRRDAKDIDIMGSLNTTHTAELDFALRRSLDLGVSTLL